MVRRKGGGMTRGQISFSLDEIFRRNLFGEVGDINPPQLSRGITSASFKFITFLEASFSRSLNSNGVKKWIFLHPPERQI